MGAESAPPTERQVLYALVAAGFVAVVAVLVFGAVLFLTGVAAFVIVAAGSVDTDATLQIMPGVLAWLLAIVAIGIGFLLGIRRMLGYAVVLAVVGVVAVALEANPGWPLLAAGVVIAAAGITLLVRFLRHNPVTATMTDLGARG